MSRVEVLVIVLSILVLGVALGRVIVYSEKINRVDETPFEFRITVHGIIDTTYYSNDPPMLGGNSIMFFDALTGLEVVEIAPKITIKRLYHPKDK